MLHINLVATKISTFRLLSARRLQTKSRAIVTDERAVVTDQRDDYWRSKIENLTATKADGNRRKKEDVLICLSNCISIYLLFNVSIIKLNYHFIFIGKVMF